MERIRELKKDRLARSGVIVAAVNVAMANGARQAKCCEGFSPCERRLERWLREKEERRTGGY